MNTRPILITGSNRSGTTWVGRMLASSPTVRYVGEFFNKDAYYLHDGCVDKNFLYIAEVDAKNITQRYSECLQYKFSSPRSRTYLRHIPSRLLFFRLSRKVIGLPRPLMKDPMSFASSEWLARTFDMQVLCLIRHPAAFVASIKKAGWYPGYQSIACQPRLVEDHLQEYGDLLAKDPADAIEAAAWRWRFTYQILLSYFDRNPSWVLWRLEDLSVAPVKSFRKIFNDLDLPFSWRTRQRIQEFSKPGNPAAAPKDNPHLIKRNSRQAQEQWRNILSFEEAQKIRVITEPIAKRFYPLNEW